MKASRRSVRLEVAILLLLVVTATGGAQSPVWSEFETKIPLPRRTTAHPFALHPTADGGLALAWMSGADGHGALYTAFFRDGKWGEPEKVVQLKRPGGFALFTWNGRTHLLECTRRYFAAREDDGWKKYPYPLPRSGRRPAVAHGPDKSVRIAYISPVRRVSRNPTHGSITEAAGKMCSHRKIVHVPIERYGHGRLSGGIEGGSKGSKFHHALPRLHGI